MKKTYIEARYRIANRVCNYGFICIDNDSIIGVFTLDCVRIDINNGLLHLYLREYNPEENCFYDGKLFIGRYDMDTLESPYTYTLKSSNEQLSLELIKRVTDPKLLSDISITFERILGN